MFLGPHCMPFETSFDPNDTRIPLRLYPRVGMPAAMQRCNLLAECRTKATETRDRCVQKHGPTVNKVLHISPTKPLKPLFCLIFTKVADFRSIQVLQIAYLTAPRCCCQSWHHAWMFNAPIMQNIVPKGSPIKIISSELSHVHDILLYKTSSSSRMRSCCRENSTLLEGHNQSIHVLGCVCC